jgi:hypothetical protein
MASATTAQLAAAIPATPRGSPKEGAPKGPLKDGFLKSVLKRFTTYSPAFLTQDSDFRELSPICTRPDSDEELTKSSGMPRPMVGYRVSGCAGLNIPRFIDLIPLFH